MAESFFSTIKRELIYQQTWTSRHDAELAIFSWIEGWYNTERIQDDLGMLSPDEFETTYYASHDTPVMAGTTESSFQ